MKPDGSVPPEPTGSKSYSSTRLGVRARVAESRALIYRHADATHLVQSAVNEMQEVESSLADVLDYRLGGRQTLELGSGPNSVQLAYLALRNAVVGTDTNIVPGNGKVADWIRVVRSNGALRVAKTVTRRALGFDRRLRAAFCDIAEVPLWPRTQMLAMDAAHLNFADASFDFVFSRAMFEHLPDPRRVLREVSRILRPGGAVCFIFHLYTSDSGCHDARILSGQRGDLPYWSHLRPRHRHRIQPNAYLNQLTLAQWRTMFAEELPGSIVTTRRSDNSNEEIALAQLRRAGELDDYSDEELLSPGVWVLWKRPDT